MATSVVNLSQYDLTRKMAPYLDPHFLFPMLRWLREANIFQDAEILAQEYDLASRTSLMLGYVRDLHRQAKEAAQATASSTSATGADSGNLPALPQLLSSPEALQKEFRERWEAGAGLWEVLSSKDRVAELRQQKQLNHEGLIAQGVTDAEVDSVFDLGHFYHRCGLYKQALEAVVLYRKICRQEGSRRYFGAVWAQLAECVCMLVNPDTPSTKRPLSSVGGNEPSDYALRVLRETIEKRTTLAPVQELEQRRWMMHWALFVIFSRSKPWEELFELFFGQREARSEQRVRKNDYLAIAQAVAPWLLRYVSYSAVMNHKNIGKRQRAFVQILQTEEPNYKDPMTRIFVALYKECNISAALAATRDSAHVIRGDFFLGNMAAKVRGSVEDVVRDFQHAALKLVFHEILKLHQELGYEQAVATYFRDFPSVTSHTLRVWVSELDRSSSGSSSSNKPVIDETKESVHCHQLFNVQIKTIHQRIDQQTNELKNTANKLRNRFHEDRAFERDMSGPSKNRGSGNNKKRSDDFELTPFQNQINSRDPRKRGKPVKDIMTDKNKVKVGQDPLMPAPVPKNTRWQPETKVAAAPAAPVVKVKVKEEDSWQRSQQPRGSADAGNWARAPKPAGTADSSSWR